METIAALALIVLVLAGWGAIVNWSRRRRQP